MHQEFTPSSLPGNQAGIYCVFPPRPPSFGADAESMRDQLSFYLNGQKQHFGGREAFSMLAPWLRSARGLTGTKIACAHGACGSCSVLLGRPTDEGFDYQPINACIFPVFACDGAHIVSVEGLNGPAHLGGQDDGFLSPVQNAMVECHGAQCGFCTPGMMVTLTAFHQQNRAPKADLKSEVQSALEGNLCRCTGYAPIIDAGVSVETADLTPLSRLYPAEQLSGDARESLEIHVAADALEGEQHLFSPRSLARSGALESAASERDCGGGRNRNRRGDERQKPGAARNFESGARRGLR